MTNPVDKQPPFARFDSQFAKEESSVRTRAAVPRRDEIPPPSVATAEPVAPDAEITQVSRETMAERTARIDHKMAVAGLLLRNLSAIDPRARLLASAILRRDEVLVDAVLAAAARQSLLDLPATSASRRLRSSR
jgi:hypothetical protein